MLAFLTCLAFQFGTYVSNMQVIIVCNFGNIIHGYCTEGPVNGLSNWVGFVIVGLVMVCVCVLCASFSG